MLEERFGYWARLYADASYLILQLIRIGTVLLLVAFAVEPMLGWNSTPPSLEHLDATQWKAAKSDRDASQAIWIGSLGYLPLSVLFCLLGTALWMHFHAGGHALPAGMKADEVFPYFIQNSLPKPVAGLVIAAILAAAVTTLFFACTAKKRRKKRGREKTG